MSKSVEKQAADMRKRIDRFRDLASESEIITEAMDGKFWNDIILPRLEADIKAFQEVYCWQLKGDDFLKARGEAEYARDLLDYILTRVGKSEEYRKKAEELAQALENAIKDGRVRPEGAD